MSTFPKQRLIDAADHLERFGWQRGHYGSHQRPCCSVGAIIHCRSDADYVFSAERLLEQHLGVNEVTSWNDKPERTAGEVIANMRGAAGMGYWGAGIVRSVSRNGDLTKS